MHTLLRFACLLGLGTVFFTILDLIWIGVVAAPMYRTEVGTLLVLGEGMTSSRITAAILTWIIIILSLICFALPKASQSYYAALGWGGLMGLAIYGVYDLTNYAVLRDWTLKVTVLDIIWGTFICAVSTAFLHGLDRWLFKNA